ncbi:pre-mRNA cleavage and polyadenylation factor (CPF) complex subunit [Serendipita sp. 411]|nr:pre-mRNA cleavage and polyadenylation factor (CPF) complex subunit [Serendipita sp. 411]
MVTTHLSNSNSAATDFDSPLLIPNIQSLPPDVWRPTKHLSKPEPPPPPPDVNPAIEAAAMAAGMDGKTLLKKTKPRRTVDYFGPMGRWLWMRKLAPSSGYVPRLRPAAPYIIDLLPPAAYPNNSATSLCTKFVHTSTNKVRGPVNCVTWTPTARRVLTGSTSGEFTLWNGLTFNFETILQAHDTAIRTFEFNHSGSFLASADQGGIVKYFQENMNCVFSYQAHPSAIRGLSFSPNDNRFVTGSDDSTLKIWAFEESREERTLTGHGWDVRCVQWHPSKGLLASGSKDNLIKFWDPRTGTCLTTLHQHKNTIQALAFSPYLDGNYLAAGSRDQSLSVFDIRAMKELRMYRGHKREVCSVAWHPIHAILASGGSEGDLLYWDLHSPTSTANVPSGSLSFNAVIPSEPRATLSQAHDSNIWSLAFHPLGHLLVSASNDHTTRFWSRERPGDSSSVFSGGGEKPPEAGDGEGEDDEAWGDAMLPGLGVPDPYDNSFGGIDPSSETSYRTMVQGNANTDLKDSDMHDDFDALPGFRETGMDSHQQSTAFPSYGESFPGMQTNSGSGFPGRDPVYPKQSRWGT